MKKLFLLLFLFQYFILAQEKVFTDFVSQQNSGNSGSKSLLRTPQILNEVMIIAVDKGATTLLDPWINNDLNNNRIGAFFNGATFGHMQYNATVLRRDATHAFEMPFANTPANSADCEHVHSIQNLKAVLAEADGLYNFNDYDTDGDGIVKIHFTSLGPGDGGVVIDGCAETTSNDTSDVTHQLIKLIVNKQSRGYGREAYFSVIYHESGHNLFGFPDMDHKGNTIFDHYGIGGFDVMSIIYGLNGKPSPYNPIFREDKGWFQPEEITNDVPGKELEEFQLNKKAYVYKPQNIAKGALAGERFYVTYHKKDPYINPLYSGWPCDDTKGGVLIWHTNQEFDYSDRRKLPIDIEAAHGKTDWNENETSVSNLGTENPFTGRDRLEVRKINSSGVEVGGGYYGMGKGDRSVFYTPDEGKEFSFTSNPNSNWYSSLSNINFSQSIVSGFSVKNIRTSNGKVLADIRINDCTITKNTTLYSGQWYFDKDLVIGPGVTLTIPPLCTLNFDEGVGIIVKGNLIIQGGQYTGASLTCSNIYKKWAGVKFLQGSSGNLNFASITKANPGLYIASSNVLIQNCTLDNNFNALICMSASPRIKNCKIRYSAERPVIVDYYSHLYLGESGERGNNQIKDNTSGGLWAYNNSYISASSGDLYSYAYNSIVGNQNYAAYAGSGCTIYAEKNWWGTSSPSSTWFSGNVIYTNALGERPVYSMALNNENYFEPMFTKSDSRKITTNEKFIMALELKNKGDYTQAFNSFINLLNEINDEEFEIHILVELNELKLKMQKESVLSSVLLNDNVKKIFSKHIVIQNILEANNSIANGNYLEGIRIYKELLVNKSVKKEIELYTLHQLVVLYSFYLNNKEESEKYFEILNTKYPDEYLTKIISGSSNETSFLQSKKLNKPYSETAEIVPEQYEIFQNFPNPFNPSTEIKYQMPKAGMVKIVVYDAVGKEVKELLNEFKEAGYHTITFNCNGLASGIYFYTMTSGSFVKTKKMQLIK